MFRSTGLMKVEWRANAESELKFGHLIECLQIVSDLVVYSSQLVNHLVAVLTNCKTLAIVRNVFGGMSVSRNCFPKEPKTEPRGRRLKLKLRISFT